MKNVVAYIRVSTDNQCGEDKFGLDVVLKMFTVIPGVNEQNYMSKYLLYGCLPFNAMLSIIVSIVTYLVYKRISFLFNS